MRFGVFNRGLRRLPLLGAFLDGQAVMLLLNTADDLDATVGWGCRKYARRARRIAAARCLPFVCLEDGFLRSFGTGQHFPPLSLVVDALGIYYDSTRPSTLESLLASPVDLLDGIAADVARAKGLVLEHRLSKYNHAPLWDLADLRLCGRQSHPLPDSLPLAGEGANPRSIQRVLVIDQTAGDMSVTLGGASADTFAAMLAAARAENPHATIYVKTHPEVSAGRKGGYLTDVQDDARTVVLRQAINPLSLIEQMDRVYVVTSTMGFEALLAGKPVTVFGMPWYAGWGATDDRQTCARRTRPRSVDALFAAAYFHYTRYLDPVTHQRGTIFDVIEWLVRQREMAARFSATASPRRMIGVGFRRWKAANIKPLLALDQRQVTFVSDVKEAETLGVQSGDCLVYWGREAPAGLLELGKRNAAPVLRMEDGFVRSVGLGSDLIRPLSLVLDERGIYFDPTRPSNLECILDTAQFSEKELARARQVRAFIVEHGITKYNLEPCEAAAWPASGKEVVLVPGQVEDDASIRYGCTDINTNLGLLQAARRAHPAAFIVYKPHPDVMSGNRAGKLALAEARALADHIELRLSVVSCIDACDIVHTMTSLTGFDALLRGKRVVVYGQPFYAGWGLTEDVLKQGTVFARRQRRLTLDELVAGTLLRYPIYWDWDLKGYTSCEAVLHRIRETRNRLEASGGLEKLRVGMARRQWRKLAILARTWLTP
ncbi:MAG TPA: capsular polysaccharide biosynthesis protein [Paucimonas sp.]|nr:capsular polysaccharide biosynthesis protein [Paucimonas sp.]HJW54059.1 capsular polysaccharide biosynthesis protein [Burkholderiaceae bacterium]